jgi:signal peptide peptidase SppA
MLSGGCDLQNVSDMIDIAEYDKSVTRVIYDFRTPGGEVTGLPETARKILRSSKETVAFTDSECCSGGMWLASQCQQFYTTPSARVGSIGVWCAYLDESRQMANEGVNMQAFSAGKFKLMGAYWKPLTGAEKAILQREVDSIYSEFKLAVNAQRSVTDDAMGEGLVFNGQDAADRGLTDGCVEDMSEVLAMAEG